MVRATARRPFTRGDTLKTDEAPGWIGNFKLGEMEAAVHFFGSSAILAVMICFQSAGT
jgi:hypothetical protein